jgi:hypothetical protein
MRVIVVFVSVLTTPSEASKSCKSKTEARQHCLDATPTRRQRQMHKVRQKIDQPEWRNSMSKMLPDEEPVQTPWVNRWVDIEPAQLPIFGRRVDIVQVSPPPIIERTEPMVTPRGVMLVIITIVLTLAIVEVLFGGTRSTGHTHRLRLGARP